MVSFEIQRVKYKRKCYLCIYEHQKYKEGTIVWNGY